MPFHPKLFYRELERVLQAIVGDPADRHWFSRITGDIVKSFGEQLHVANGRLYTETTDGFLLEQDVDSRDPPIVGLLVPHDYPPLQEILANGVYLFDATTPGQDPALEERLGGIESGALLVDDRPRRILAFGLREGWERVHLDFALHT